MAEVKPVSEESKPAPVPLPTDGSVPASNPSSVPPPPLLNTTKPKKKKPIKTAKKSAKPIPKKASKPLNRGALLGAIAKRRKVEIKYPIEIPIDKWHSLNHQQDDEKKEAKSIKYVSIVCLSDTHMGHKKLTLPSISKASKDETKNGDKVEHDPIDILVLSGDFTNNGSISEAKVVNDWFGKLKKEKKCKHILLILGNHEGYSCGLASGVVKDELETEPNSYANSIAQFRKIMTNCEILHDEAKVIEGIKFYGTPWTPHLSREGAHGTGKAYFVDRGIHIKPESRKIKWEKIPKDVDYLITHTPPYYILDATGHGCFLLLEKLKDFKKLKVHQFGHCHAAYGWCFVEKDSLKVNKDIKDMKESDIIKWKKKDRIEAKIKKEKLNIVDDFVLFVNAANAANVDMWGTPDPKDDSFEQPIWFKIPVVDKQ